MNQLNDQDLMTRWASCLLSKRINTSCRKFTYKRLEEKLAVRVKKGPQMCSRSRTTFVLLFHFEKKDISPNAILLLCFVPVRENWAGVLKWKNSPYEKWTHVNDQRLVSFFICIHIIDYSDFLHFLDNWLRNQMNGIEERRRRLRQKGRSTLHFSSVVYFEIFHRWSVCEHLSS